MSDEPTMAASLSNLGEKIEGELEGIDPSRYGGNIGLYVPYADLPNLLIAVKALQVATRGMALGTGDKVERIADRLLESALACIDVPIADLRRSQFVKASPSTPRVYLLRGGRR